ncbi:MAG: TRAP transporter large permease subunit [Deltaproteobacteria bacterium]|jgi:tripartite ATP-independent transporter DctM subunit|nr:TRAP transporter large permease subunit [Deltaproteobacteria bacterium]MBW2479697.1 TRAP transporter large permease subunit [Deltaproteobacteria bacterium]
MVIIAVLVLLLLLLFVGMPVAFALGISGIVGMYFTSGFDGVYSLLYTVPYRTAASYTMTVIPMFVLMAQAVSHSGLVGHVFEAARRWLERLPAGMAIAAILSSAGVAAMSGSSVASAATTASIAIPEMKKSGYKTHVAAGVVTVAGTLAIMIPPSVGLVIYGVITENSIGQMLIAGVIPGIMTALVYISGVILWQKFSPMSMPPVTSRYSWAQRFHSLKPIWPFMALVLMVIGSIYLGWATVTEAASVGALGAIGIPIIQGRMAFRDVVPAVIRTLEITTMIFAIIIGAMIFGYFLTMTQTPNRLILLISAMNLPAWFVLMLFLAILMILGLMLDQLAIVLITLPLMYPVVIDLGYHPIWFGIIVVKVAEIGLVTPPVGMNAYVVSATTGIPLEKVFRGVGVMLLFELITLALLLSFPVLATWLPSLMLLR